MQPTRWSALVFALKVTLLRAARTGRELAQGTRPARGKRSQRWREAPVVGRSITSLWTQTSAAELRLTAGKVENLRIAARALDGVEIEPGAAFSFWRELGRPTRLAGYREGREIREGCVVPSIAGGLCQLSNALYDAALSAGLEIVERHAHTRVIPGSLAEKGRDATVFWNYVDLRFRSPTGLRIEVEMTGADLVVSLRAPKPAVSGEKAGFALGKAPLLAAASCETCGVHSCFRHQDLHEDGTHAAAFSGAALLDGVWPEHARWLTQWIEAERAVMPVEIYLPLDGARRRLARYAWNTEGAVKVREAPLVAFWRAWRSRRMAAQGAARQRMLQKLDLALASAYARKLPVTALHLVVQQSLLVPLARIGALGGRTFDVLMTRPPAQRLESTLDKAKARHPESVTLGDFRAAPEWVAEESRILSRARKVITPHAQIVSFFPDRGEMIPWVSSERDGLISNLPRRIEPGTVLFAGPTAGRKGAFAMREAARSLRLKVVLQGAELEGEDFWSGVEIERLAPGTAALDAALTRVAAVFAPAWVESRPVVCLDALKRGVPVFATAACGLGERAGVTTLPEATGASIISAWNGAAKSIGGELASQA